MKKTLNTHGIKRIIWLIQTIHPARPGTLKLKAIVILNSKAVIYRINSSELKTLFTSNHEEVDVDIVCSCSRFNIPCIVKAKDTNIIILMIYSFVVKQLKHDCLMQADKDSFVSIRKIYKKCGSTTCLLLQQYHTIIGCDTVSYLFNVLKRVVFEQTSGILPFNVIVELGSSNK